MRLRHSCTAKIGSKSKTFFQRALGSYTHMFPKHGTASLTDLILLVFLSRVHWLQLKVHDVITSCLLCGCTAVSLWCSSTADQTGYDLTFAPKQEVVLQVAASLLLEWLIDWLAAGMPGSVMLHDLPFSHLVHTLADSDGVHRLQLSSNWCMCMWCHLLPVNGNQKWWLSKALMNSQP